MTAMKKLVSALVPPWWYLAAIVAAMGIFAITGRLDVWSAAIPILAILAINGLVNLLPPIQDKLVVISGACVGFSVLAFWDGFFSDGTMTRYLVPVIPVLMAAGLEFCREQFKKIALLEQRLNAIEDNN